MAERRRLRSGGSGKSQRKNSKSKKRTSTLRIEPLDARVMLDASGQIGEAVEFSHSAEILAAPVPSTQVDTVITDNGNGVGVEVSASFRREIVFIDAGVEGQEVFLASLRVSRPGVLREVIMIDSASDGVAQIATALEGRSSIDALHIVSHGENAALRLGNSIVTTESLVVDYAERLQAVGAALSTDADILLYGCDLASQSSGVSFMQTLSNLTDTDVAASDDLTGAAALGGDWDLEVVSGDVETDSLNIPVYQHVLAAPAIDLDANDSSTATGINRTALFMANDGPVNIADSDVTVIDSDGDDLSKVTIDVLGIEEAAKETVTFNGDGSTSVAITLDAASSDNKITIGGTTYDIDYSDTAFTITNDGGGNLTASEVESLLAGVTFETTGVTSRDRVFWFTVVDSNSESSRVAVSTMQPDSDGDGVGNDDDGDDDNDGILDADEFEQPPASGASHGVDGAFDEFTVERGALPLTPSTPGANSWFDVTFTADIAAPIVGVGDSYIGTVESPAGGNFLGMVQSASNIEKVSVQVDDLEVGSIYEVSFYFVNSGRKDIERDPVSVVVSVPTTEATEFSSPVVPYDPTTWLEFTVQFVADTPSADLVFSPATPVNDGGIGIDGVQIRPVGRSTGGSLVSDHLDLDSDNDGISDLFENTANAAIIAADRNGDGSISLTEADLANDGILNNNGDANNDGIMDIFAGEAAPLDTDSDGIDDYLDLDSDNDGIADAIEGRPTASYDSFADDGSDNVDADGDGVLDKFDTNNVFGGTHANFIAPPDTENDGTPDFRDTNSDGDGMLDRTESGLVLSHTDQNGDGIDDNSSIGASYANPDGVVNQPSSDLDSEFGDTSEVGYRETTPREWTFTGDTSVDEGAIASYTIGNGLVVSAGEKITVDLSIADIATNSDDYGAFDTAVSAAVAVYNAGSDPGSLAWDGTTLTFTSDGTGAMGNLVIDLPAVNDSLVEGDEVYRVAISNPTVTAVVSTITIDPENQAVTTTIADVQTPGGDVLDGPAVWSITGPTQTPEATTAEFVVSLSGTYQAGETVSTVINFTDVSTDNGDYGDPIAAIQAAANANPDVMFHSATNTLTYTAPSDGASMTQLVIKLPITEDGITEPDEQYEIALSSPSSATGVTTTASTTDGKVTADIRSSVQANPDFVSTAFNTSVSANVLANDLDPNGGALTVTAVNGMPITAAIMTSSGTVTMQSDGSFLYTPNHGFIGTDTFEYDVCDPHGRCSTAITSIDVRANGTVTNGAPVAVDDAFTGFVDQQISSGLFGNDSDPDGDTITFVDPATGEAATAAVTVMTNAGGTAFVQPDGTFVYTPAVGYIGEDTFRYAIIDPSGVTGSADVALTVAADANGAVNDPPVGAADKVIVQKNQPTSGNLLANDIDPNGDALTVNTTPVVHPEHGTVVISPDGTFTYTPDSGYVGIDSFTYEVCDSHGSCDTAEAQVVIGNSAPVARADELVTIVDTPVSGNALVNDSDKNDEMLVVTHVDGQPLNAGSIAVENGSVVMMADGSFVFTPASGYTGTVTFDYTIADETGFPAVATIEIEIRDASVASDATPPVATNDTYTVLVDQPVTSSLIVNDGDPNSSSIQINTTPVTHPNNGTVTIHADGTFTYTPNSGFIGTDTFTYEIADAAGNTDTATVSVQFVPDANGDANDVPFAVTDIGIGQMNDPIHGSLLTNDSDINGDALAVTEVNGMAIAAGGSATFMTAAGGTVVVHSDGTYHYTPAANSTGNDTFTYTTSDGAGGSASANVHLTVFGRPPALVADAVEVVSGDSATGNVLTNDSDPDTNDSLTVKYVNGQRIGGPIMTSHGTVMMNADGSFTYTPNTGFDGTDSFTYEVCDISGNCATATVLINVLPALAVGKVTGAVYLDTNGNGLRDAGELGLANATISLTGVDERGYPVSLTAQTDAGGMYQFADVAVGTYTLMEMQPNGFLDGAEVAGSFGGNISVNDKITVTISTGADTFHATGYNFTELGIDPRVAGKERFLISMLGYSNTVTQANGIQESSTQSPVVEKGQTLLVTGTSADDDIKVYAGVDRHVIMVNGQVFAYDAQTFTSIEVSAGEGSDLVTIAGSTLDDQAELFATRGRLRSSDYTIEAEGAEEISVYGGGGYDRAILADSVGNDVFLGSATFASMRELRNAYRNEARDFEVISGNSVLGGYDRAIVYGTSGDDHLRMLPEFSQLRRGAGSTEFRANRFESFEARGVSGDDTAEIVDSSGNDLLEVSEETVRLVGTGFNSLATDFQKIDVQARRGGQDIIEIHDVDPNELFTGTGATLNFATRDFSVTGFDRVRAQSKTSEEIETHFLSIDFVFEQLGL